MSLRIEKPQRGHAVEGFDCGREVLNRFLIRHALQNEQVGMSQRTCEVHPQPIWAVLWGPAGFPDAQRHEPHGNLGRGARLGSRQR